VWNAAWLSHYGCQISREARLFKLGILQSTVSPSALNPVQIEQAPLWKLFTGVHVRMLIVPCSTAVPNLTCAGVSHTDEHACQVVVVVVLVVVIIIVIITVL
jgi:hypothetical protein